MITTTIHPVAIILCRTNLYRFGGSTLSVDTIGQPYADVLWSNRFESKHGPG